MHVFSNFLLLQVVLAVELMMGESHSHWLEMLGFTRLKPA